jgi:hypothetical protein
MIPKVWYRVNNMLIELEWQTCWWIGVKTRVTSFKLTKYDLATAYLDTVDRKRESYLFWSWTKKGMILKP